MAETPKKTRTTKAATSARPRKAVTAKSAKSLGPDKANGHQGTVPEQHDVSHEEVARLAHSFWQQRGGRHGNHVDDWIRAEQELRARAS